MLDHAGIRALLPQRYPMLLLDRVVDVAVGERLTALKAVTAAEPCYRDLPDGAGPAAFAYPASLLVESFGQAAAVLWLLSRPHEAPGRLPVFAALRDVALIGRAYPGDVLRHEVRLDQLLDRTAFGSGETWVGDRRIAMVGSLLAVVRPVSSLAPTGPEPKETATDDRHHHEPVRATA
jgi:3-hydroxyacyl-[acyl-carrier-protein] dehydratase